MRLLGTISVGTGATKNNADTAAPFVVPEHDTMLAYVPSATGLTFAHKATADANDFPLGTGGKVVPWVGRDTGRIALWNTTGGTLTCKVYALDKPGVLLNL